MRSLYFLIIETLYFNNRHTSIYIAYSGPLPFHSKHHAAFNHLNISPVIPPPMQVRGDENDHDDDDAFMVLPLPPNKHQESHLPHHSLPAPVLVVSLITVSLLNTACWCCTAGATTGPLPPAAAVVMTGLVFFSDKTSLGGLITSG